MVSSRTYVPLAALRLLPHWTVGPLGSFGGSLVGGTTGRPGGKLDSELEADCARILRSDLPVQVMMEDDTY